MAIDSALKRRSAAGLPGLPLGPGVTPDAARPLAWRQSAGWGYAGIAAGAAAVLVPVASRTLANLRPRTRGIVNAAPRRRTLP